MNPNAAKSLFGVALALILVVTASLSRAQAPAATLSGIVNDFAGKAVPNAKVSIKNAATGESSEFQTDSAGKYTIPNLAAGDYEISASAEGVGTGSAKATLVAGSQQTMNLSLSTVSGSPPPAAESLPNAPSTSKTEPSLEDLGFSKTETQSNAAQQALLDKRTHMLKIHQRTGLITAIPLLASVITSVNAGGKSTGTTSRDLHVALGALTGDLYGITAYYAIRAPRVPGTETRGPIRVHKVLAWIHGPGMILTPILGAMAFNQKNNGEKVHGIAAAHGPVAIVTAGAFGAALLAVSVKF